MALRVNTVYGWLCHGWQRGKIQEEGKKLWGVHTSNIDIYIKRAREVIDQDYAMSRQVFLAEVLDRLRTYEQKAASKGQLQVATNSVRLQAELIGLIDKMVDLLLRSTADDMYEVCLEEDGYPCMLLRFLNASGARKRKAIARQHQTPNS